METFLNSNSLNLDFPFENHYKSSILSHLLSKSHPPETSEETVLIMDDIETSAWVEHVHSALPRNPACSIYTASTENSLCANNGSFDTNGLDELFKGLRSEDSDELQELFVKPVRLESSRDIKRKRKGGVRRVIMKAKRIMTRMFGRYIVIGKTKKMIRQQMRRNKELWRYSFKDFYLVVRVMGNRSLKKGFKVCCCGSGEENQEGHGLICGVVRKLWRQFLDKNVQDWIWRRMDLSGNMKKILMELSVLLRRNLK